MSIMRKQKIAKNLLTSFRGQYIISEALYTAIDVMKKEPVKKREVSNIEDMEILGGELFPICFRLAKAEKELKERQKEVKNGR